MQGLKDQVQELHRDLTKHHSLIKAEIMGDVLSKSLQLDVQIASEHTSLEGMRVVFQEVAFPRTLTPVPPVRGHLGYPDSKQGKRTWLVPYRTVMWQGLEPGSLCCLESRGPGWGVLCRSE